MWLLNIWTEWRYLLSTSTYVKRFFAATFCFVESRILGNYDNTDEVYA